MMTITIHSTTLLSIPRESHFCQCLCLSFLHLHHKSTHPLQTSTNLRLSEINRHLHGPRIRLSPNRVRFRGPSLPPAVTRANDSDYKMQIAWAKDEPPSPTDSHHEPPPPGGSRGSSESRRPHVVSYHAPIERSSSEHRWFPFTRRRPVLPSDPPIHPENISAVFGTPSTTYREAYSPTFGEKSVETRPSHVGDGGLPMMIPIPPPAPYTLSHSRTPGWDSPWVARPLESLSHRNTYAQLHNGGSTEEQLPDGSVSWWPRTRKRARAYLLNNTHVPLVEFILLSDFVHPS